MIEIKRKKRLLQGEDVVRFLYLLLLQVLNLNFLQDKDKLILMVISQVATGISDTSAGYWWNSWKSLSYALKMSKTHYVFVIYCCSSPKQNVLFPSRKKVMKMFSSSGFEFLLEENSRITAATGYCSEVQHLIKLIP